MASSESPSHRPQGTGEPRRGTAQIDTEWLAFVAGIKPALRRTADPGHASAAEARLVGQGAVVVRAHAEVRFGGGPQVILYAAKTQEAAEALRSVEARILPGVDGNDRVPADERLARHREVGERLGFPPCCVEAFAQRFVRGEDSVGGGGPRGLAEDYVAARDAWLPRADARLNHLLFAARMQLVGFYPCRYDCALAIVYANRVLRAVRRAHGEAAATDLLATLARPLVIAPTGARAWVELDEARRVAAATAPTDDAGDVALAAALIGKVVGGDGAVADVPGMPVPAWCVPFSAPSPSVW